MEFNDDNSKRENVEAINVKIFHFFFLKIVEIELKMKLEIFSSLKFFQVPAKLDFPYLSPHISKWNESKLPTIIKIYTIRYNF